MLLTGGIIAGLVTCPFDCFSTCMKGDMKRKIYCNFLDTMQNRSLGGIKSLYSGLGWRIANITVLYI